MLDPPRPFWWLVSQGETPGPYSPTVRTGSFRARVRTAYGPAAPVPQGGGGP